jgi:glycine hydroxymethyltransferase
VPHADYVTTTTHKTLRGPRSGIIMCREEYAKDIDKAVFPGLQGGPLCHIVAAKAVCFLEASQPAFAKYAAQIVANAKQLAETLTAGGVRLATGGTDNHLMLCDVTPLGLTGKIAEHALDRAGITVNKNMIPYDPRKPLDPSGIRIGTAALTTRGMKEAEMKRVGGWILEVLRSPEDERVATRLRNEIKQFAADFPVPGIG